MRLLLAILMVAAMLGATDARAADWTVGLKGGVSIATAGGDDAGDAGSRTAFAGGGYAQADFNESFGIRLEGLYFMKGVTDAVDGNADFSWHLDYVEFPVLLIGQAPVSKTASLSVFAGPSFSINTSSTTVIELGDVTTSVGIDDAINDFDVGLTFGAGANFQAGSVVIVVDGRYDLGLTSFADGLNNGEELDFKNQAWAFMAGVGFPIAAQ
jgi:hypothetical protein